MISRAALARRAHDYPKDLSAQTDDELLRLLKEDQVPDPTAMSQLQPEDREVLGALIDGVTNFRNGLRQNNNMLLSQKVAPLIDMSERLKAQAELTIPTVTFVTALTGYGNYTPLKPAQFVAGKRQLTHIYFEVENFASQLNANQMYETRLRVTRVLYTEGNGMPVLNDPSVNVTDYSYRRRHDYFVRSDMVLPANLTIGRYLLKVTVEDLTGPPHRREHNSGGDCRERELLTVNRRSQCECAGHTPRRGCESSGPAFRIERMPRSDRQNADAPLRRGRTSKPVRSAS